MSTTLPPSRDAGGFATAAAVVAEVARRRSAGARIVYVLTHPVQMARLLLVLRRLPRLRLVLPPDAVAERVLQELRRRRWGLPVGSIARSVLVVPRELDAYVRGRSRQALRTNLTQAAAAGISCREVVAPAEKRAALLTTKRGEQDADEWARWAEERLRVSVAADRCFAAETREGELAAVAFVTVHPTCAVLRWHVRTDAGGGAARYALMHHLVGVLVAETVPLLVVDNALQLSEGLRYFQERLGFFPANLHVRRAEPRG